MGRRRRMDLAKAPWRAQRRGARALRHSGSGGTGRSTERAGGPNYKTPETIRFFKAKPTCTWHSLRGSCDYGISLRARPVVDGAFRGPGEQSARAGVAEPGVLHRHRRPDRGGGQGSLSAARYDAAGPAVLMSGERPDHAAWRESSGMTRRCGDRREPPRGWEFTSTRETGDWDDRGERSLHWRPDSERHDQRWSRGGGAAVGGHVTGRSTDMVGLRVPDHHASASGSSS